METKQNIGLTQNELAMGKNIDVACIIIPSADVVFLTFCATSLQTLSLIFKVVLVAQTPSILEEFAAP